MDGRAAATGRCGVTIVLLLHLACSSTETSTPIQRTTPEQEPLRCSIRMTSKGITVDGDAMDRDRAVLVCKSRTEALVELGDDASDDEWQALRTALTDGGVKILMRGSRGHDDCKANPLAKGCM